MYLIHYGTKNMQWGVRKYQNEDGSLTEAGKKRYRDTKKRDKYGNPIDNFNYNHDKSGQQYAYDMGRRDRNYKNAVLEDIRAMEKFKSYHNGLTPNFFRKTREQERLNNLRNGNPDASVSYEKFEEQSKEIGAMPDMKVITQLPKMQSKVSNKSSGMPSSDIAARNKEAEKKKKNAIPTSAYQSMTNGSKKTANVVKKVSGMPTSAIKAQNEAKIKANIPVSAWNQRINSLI